MTAERIIPDWIHADDAALDKWFARVFEELGATIPFPRSSRWSLTPSLRFAREEADEEERDGQAEAERSH